MINNIQNLFIKYKFNNPKNKTLDLFIAFLKKELDLDIKKDDFKLDIKNKTIYLNKNNSSLKFFIKSKLGDENKDILEKELGVKISI